MQHGIAQGIVRWLVLTVAVWIAATVVPGIAYDGWQNLVIAALVLGILNSFVKPLISILSLPFIILTLGFFLLVINAALLGLVARLVPGFHVGGFWSAVGGSLVISLVSVFLGSSGRVERGRFGRTSTLYGSRREPPPGQGPIIDV